MSLSAALEYQDKGRRGIYVHEQLKTSLYLWSKEIWNADEAKFSAKNFFSFAQKGSLTVFHFPLLCSSG